MRRQAAGPHGLLGQLTVGGGAHKVAGEAEEHPGLPVAHGPDGVHRVEAVLGRGSEPELLLQGIQERLGHLLPDSHRPIALYVAVSADWSYTCARATQVAA